MGPVWLPLLMTGLVAAPASDAHVQRDESLALRVARFYRGDRTLVNGFFEVPVAALGAVPGPAPVRAVFHVDLVVRDTTDAVLWRDGWARAVDVSSGQLGSTTVEALAVALSPGNYRIEIAVRDSATGRTLTGAAAVAAYAAKPSLSDVLVANAIRSVQGADTAARAGELRKGDLLITAAPMVSLRPGEARLYFYSEVYQDSAQSVPWRIEVAERGGRVVVATATTTTGVGPGGGVITGSIDLAGLPPGSYALREIVGVAGDTVMSEAEFQMGDFDLDRRVAQAQNVGGGGTGPLDVAGDADLDALYEPLIHIATPRELAAYRGLSAEGKRRFLRQFWEERDPTPTTVRNEAQDSFYARVAMANREFREGGRAGVEGWRTDRGRIYVKHGQPNEVLRRPQAGAVLPWEAWKYLADRPRKYVFMDETRLGNYVLIYSDDIRERSYPNWDSILGDEAVQEIRRF